MLSNNADDMCVVWFIEPIKGVTGCLETDSLLCQDNGGCEHLIQPKHLVAMHAKSDKLAGDIVGAALKGAEDASGIFQYFPIFSELAN